ncbi:MAG: hypothetical protein V4508_20700 [Pseudomonadota bacterium]
MDNANDPANLATRNLLRGQAMQLPCGQAVARAMGLEAIADPLLKIGKAALEGWEGAIPLADIDPGFRDNAPLWFYILAEARYDWFRRATGPCGGGNAEPLALGQVGGRIVAETLVGLAWADPFSYLAQEPNWVPAVGGTDLTMGALIKFALTGAI